ncbi:MAG: hypothetical protein Q8L87_18665 [Anaerolineales bacterium]|nr:hypothetical protein [Anaerolineales bacterium]
MALIKRISHDLPALTNRRISLHASESTRSGHNVQVIYLQLLSDRSGPPAATPTMTPQSLGVERIANQRVRLLAAKYAGSNETQEIVARLEILNRRLLSIAPRVSEEQVASLERAHEQLTRIRAAREERSKRLGIPV